MTLLIRRNDIENRIHRTNKYLKLLLYTIENICIKYHASRNLAYNVHSSHSITKVVSDFIIASPLLPVVPAISFSSLSFSYVLYYSYEYSTDAPQ